MTCIHGFSPNQHLKRCVFVFESVKDMYIINYLTSLIQFFFNCKTPGWLDIKIYEVHRLCDYEIEQCI